MKSSIWATGGSMATQWLASRSPGFYNCFFFSCAAAPRVYRFPVFEKSFCEELVEELEHFEQSAAPKGRPNTMNHYGVINSS